MSAFNAATSIAAPTCSCYNNFLRVSIRTILNADASVRNVRIRHHLKYIPSPTAFPHRYSKQYKESITKASLLLFKFYSNDYYRNNKWLLPVKDFKNGGSFLCIMKEACTLTNMTYENLKFYCNEGLVPKCQA